MQSCYRQHCWCTQLLQSALFEAKEHCTASCSDILAQPRDIQEISARDIPARRRDIGENLQLPEPELAAGKRNSWVVQLRSIQNIKFDLQSCCLVRVWSSDSKTDTGLVILSLWRLSQAEENEKKVEEKIDRHSESLGLRSNNVAVAITINQGHKKSWPSQIHRWHQRQQWWREMVRFRFASWVIYKQNFTTTD